MPTDFPLEYAMKRIHFKARQMVGTHGFTQDDFEDLRQELMADVLKQLEGFDGDRAGIRVFITTLIDRRIADIISYNEADCRDYRRIERSLDDWVPDDSAPEGDTWTTLGEALTEEQAKAHLGQARRSPQERADLAMDLSKVLEQFPPGYRRLCLQLQVKTVTEISQETGLARCTIYRRIRAIRQKLIEAGLHRYSDGF